VGKTIRNKTLGRGRALAAQKHGRILELMTDPDGADLDHGGSARDLNLRWRLLFSRLTVSA